MKRNAMKYLAITACVGAVAIVVVLAYLLGEDGSSERRPDVPLAAPEASAKGADLRKPTDEEGVVDVSEGLLDDITDELDISIAEEVPGEPATDAVRSLLQDEMVLKIVETRVAAIEQIGIYHLIRDEVRAKVLAEYGAVTLDTIAEFLKVATKIEEKFWAEGGFESRAALAELYEARALLEMCLEADPGNEPVHREYIDVLWAGWPVGHNRLQGGTAHEGLWLWRHRYDLYEAILPLWEDYLAKCETLPREDFGYATDLLFWALPVKPLPAQPEERAAVLGDLRKLDVPPPDEFLAFCERGGISTEKMLEIAERGAVIAEQSGMDRVAQQFREYAQWVKEGARKQEKVRPSMLLFTEPQDLYPSVYDWWSYIFGRGQSWQGPSARDAKRLDDEEMTVYINEKLDAEDARLGRTRD